LHLSCLYAIIASVFAEHTLNTLGPTNSEGQSMVKLEQVAGVTTPPDFGKLKAGTYTLRAPVFDSDNAEGGALQVGLEPNEFDDKDKRDIVATIREDFGHLAIEVALASGEPFTIESSLDSDEGRVNALGRAAVHFIVRDSLHAWMDIEADGEEPLMVNGPEGINRFVQNLVAFSLIKQEAATKAEAAE
jgi:hypothetical protein